MKRLTRAFITLVPVITLFVVTASVVLYTYKGDQYLEWYSLLSNVFGFSLCWLPVYFYMAKAYHLCNYTSVALWSLTLYSVINVLCDISDLIGLPMSYMEYMILIQGIGIGSGSFVTSLFIIQNIYLSYGKRAN